MKRILFGISAGVLLVGCTGDPSDESAGEADQALDVSLTRGLTKNQGGLPTGSGTEDARETDTTSYYANTQIDNAGNTIKTGLGTLGAFKSKYFPVGTAESVAYYYNRGDLGLGREMHCEDTLSGSGGEVACYVSNFAAGDPNSEFTFGESANIAFTNMNGGQSHAFATVAMVFRYLPFTPDAANNVFFVVYNALGNLQSFAALDRTGQLAFNSHYAANGPRPGIDFNNHLPSNCLSCHGGGNQYNATSKSVTGALFLPFDLDQFEYQNVAGKTKPEQLNVFQALNLKVWKVAALAGSSAGATPLVNQLDNWYGNAGHHEASPIVETFPSGFNSAIGPAGWTTAPTSAQGPSLYANVVRGSCRNCHAANKLIPFDTEQSFLSFSGDGVSDPGTIASDLCSFAMPHSLQTVRQFWQSSQPNALINYWIANGKTQAAAKLKSCGPGNVATLDPPQISTVLASAALE